jgi:hypothetical protein
MVRTVRDAVPKATVLLNVVRRARHSRRQGRAPRAVGG